ncbi:hypothetical protein Cantr_03820 [Candida viswanathii]|uniref:Uncharacterized protein n=1 Tax=Candida viswanathii TaxID=5486 RepID=A0A367XP62_9ASCO|nr:hypothetical protein Cantr_03820 [Candida viswanathii]
MKVLSIAIVASLLLLTHAATVPEDLLPLETPAPTPTSSASENVHLFKRMRDIIINKDYAKNQAAKTQSSTTVTPPPKWYRTRDGSVEIITPTVIQGVTFSAKPPATTNGLEWWVSLKDDGSPKTIKPQNKNGQIKNGRPDYSTWFQTATTITYNKEELKAHNMADDEIFEEVQYIQEADLDNHLLSPLVRCTPDRYKKKGIGRDRSTAPFCTPKDNARLTMGKVYFVTWYSRFWGDDVKNVRVHLNYINEKWTQKGLKKRDDEFGDGEEEFIEERSDNNTEDVTRELTLSKRSSVLEAGGKISSNFFTSDLIDVDVGWFPLDISPDWFDKEYWRKVLISVVPEGYEDKEDYNIFKDSIVIEIWKGVKVSKGHLEDLKRLEEKYANRHMYDIEVEEGINFDEYMMMIALPTCAVLAAVGMWLFVRINKIDLSKVKKRKFAREQTSHRRIPFITKKKKDAVYSELPQFSTELDNMKKD